MLQIRFAGNFSSEDSLNKILPTGYQVSTIDVGNKYDVLIGSDEKAGSIERSGSMLVILFDETPEGRDFVSAWGLNHRDLNPKTILYGYVYYVLETDRWQLDQNPDDLPETAMAKIDNYKKADNVCYVTFLRGEWHPDSLTVISMQKVLPSGKLGKDTGPKTLQLGNIENERTM